MTKQHFIHMASVVRAILDGQWTHEFPPYGNESRNIRTLVDETEGTADNNNYTRAVWTAEAFIKVAAEHNPRFDQDRFLIACGLKDAPVKVRKSRKVSA